MKTYKNQQGFAVLEALLILVVLAIIGFSGWFVYHSKQSTEKTLTSASNANIAQTSTKQAASSSVQTGTTKYLKVSEWGIKLPLSGDVAGLSYTLGSSYGSFTDTKLSSYCSDKTGMPNEVIVARGKATDHVPAEVGDGRTFAALVKDSPADVYAHIGDYYYVQPDFRGASCAATASGVQDEGAAAQAVEATLRKATAE